MAAQRRMGPVDPPDGLADAGGDRGAGPLGRVPGVAWPPTKSVRRRELVDQGVAFDLGKGGPLPVARVLGLVELDLQGPEPVAVLIDRPPVEDGTEVPGLAQAGLRVAAVPGPGKGDGLGGVQLDGRETSPRLGQETGKVVQALGVVEADGPPLPGQLPDVAFPHNLAPGAGAARVSGLSAVGARTRDRVMPSCAYSPLASTSRSSSARAAP